MVNILTGILNSEKRNHLAIAAAGSGKTSKLLSVLIEKIKLGAIDPLKSEVVVFTFTNDAADELAVRLTQALRSEQEILNRIFIGTIHGWCNEFLQKEGTLANTKVVDELEQSQLLLRIYPLLNIKDVYEGKNKFRKIEKFLNDLNLFYDENLSISNEIIPDGVRRCIREYIEFMHTQRLLDFGSLIREAIARISSLQEREYHIFVDEYQDVNLAQVRLIQSLLSLHGRSTLFAVGDPRQAIYQWRGSDIRRILSFAADFGDSEKHTMRANFRSKTGIVRFANAVASSMDFTSYSDVAPVLDEMYPKRADDAISVIHEMGNISHEEYIARRIKDLHNDGTSYADIAVLMRSVVHHADTLMEVFDDQRIPYYSPNKNAGTVFIQEFMGSIFSLVELMAEVKEPANRQEEEEVEQKVHQSLETIKKYCNDISLNSIHVAVAAWYKKLASPTKTRSSRSKTSRLRYPNEAYNFRQHFFDFCNEIGFAIDERNIELQEGFSAITQIMRAIEEIYRRRFRGAGVRSPPVEVFLGNLRWQIDHEIDRWAETGLEINGGGDRVTISTVHAAKGLEWPVVFLPFLWVNRFPLRSSSHGTSFPDEIAGRYGTTREDEKRLWYVAITRARDRLYFYSGSMEGRSPSPFTYSDIISSNPHTMVEVDSLEGNENLSVVEAHEKERYLNLGVSDLLLLFECPYHFYLRRMKGVEVPVGEEFGAGNVVHRVIERLLGEVKGKMKASDELVDEEVYLPLADYTVERNIRNAIRLRMRSLAGSGHLDNVSMTEIPFRMTMGNITVFGIVDAIRRTPQGIEIIDWKSSIHERFKRRYENQICMYAAGLRQRNHNVVGGLIYDLKKLQEGTADFSHSVNVSEERVTEMMQKAERELALLISQHPSLRRSLTSCMACDVRSICPNPWVEAD